MLAALDARMLGGLVYGYDQGAAVPGSGEVPDVARMACDSDGEGIARDLVWAVRGAAVDPASWRGQCRSCFPGDRRVTERTAELEVVMKYEVTTSFDGKWWVFDIPALVTTINGREIVARGQARTASEIAGEATGIVAMWTDADEGTITVEVTYSIPDEIREAISRAQVRETEARAAEQEAAQARRFAARALVTGQGMTQADAAVMLGVSRQRVHQLVS